MKDEIVPIATVGSLLATIVLGILGDALILMIAPQPLVPTRHVWWALIPIPLIHHLGLSLLSEYCRLVHLPEWSSIHSWAIRYPGLWGWITFATWWWTIAAAISFGITLWIVWRRPHKPDQFLRGTHLTEDIKAYRRLQRDLEREE